MPDKEQPSAATDEQMGKVLTQEAKRALSEAEDRRRQKDAKKTKPAKEIGGRDGDDPVRYGDWEKGGIAWDF